MTPATPDRDGAGEPSVARCSPVAGPVVAPVEPAAPVVAPADVAAPVFEPQLLLPGLGSLIAAPAFGGGGLLGAVALALIDGTSGPLAGMAAFADRAAGLDAVPAVQVAAGASVVAVASAQAAGRTVVRAPASGVGAS